LRAAPPIATSFYEGLWEGGDRIESVELAICALVNRAAFQLLAPRA
jgi:hypothetical protein